MPRRKTVDNFIATLGRDDSSRPPPRVTTTTIIIYVCNIIYYYFLPSRHFTRVSSGLKLGGFRRNSTFCGFYRLRNAKVFRFIRPTRVRRIIIIRRNIYIIILYVTRSRQIIEDLFVYEHVVIITLRLCFIHRRFVFFSSSDRRRKNDARYASYPRDQHEHIIQERPKSVHQYLQRMKIISLKIAFKKAFLFIFFFYFTR